LQEKLSESQREGKRDSDHPNGLAEAEIREHQGFLRAGLLVHDKPPIFCHSRKRPCFS
jgi:hypothetical protein